MPRLHPALLGLVLLCAACRAQIHHGLEEKEANEIQTVLQDAGIDAQKVPERGKKPTWAIEVPSDDATEAVRLLSALELPRPRMEGMGQVLTASGLVPTPTEERLKEVHLLSEQAALALQRVEGVSSAQVQLSLPPPARPGQVRPAPKAAAIVRLRPGALERVEPLREGLRALVAGGVDGLLPENVEVVLQETAPPARDTRPGGLSPLGRMRVLSAVLGGVVSALALGLVFLTLRLRQARAQVHTLQAALPPPTPARPVVSPSAARKVA